jgi:predicted transcriptional regulator
MPGQGGIGRGSRRGNGVLVSAVLKVLWEASEPLSPAEVRERLAKRGEGGRDLAHTTVVTILSRLYERNVLSRARHGRTFHYAPVVDEAGMAARRLSVMLNAAPNRSAVLSRFVADLSDYDEQVLRAVLDARADRSSDDAEQD